MGIHCSEKSREVPAILASLLETTNIHFIDSHDSVSMNKIDYMHLDVEGHRRMAELVMQHIKRILN
ncbi:hypothetical protein D3C73_1347810 [compost metagenome]